MADNQSRPQLSLNKAQSAAPEKPQGEQITYVPGPEDAASTKWHGYTFHANVPKTVTHAGLIEQAKGNKFFRVGAFDPAKDAVKIAEQGPAPRTPEQYRSHAVEWFKTAKSVEELDNTWIAEEKLREKCGVGTDDLDYLLHLFQPRRAELRKMASPT